MIRTDTLEELFDVAALLSTQPVPRGRARRRRHQRRRPRHPARRRLRGARPRRCRSWRRRRSRTLRDVPAARRPGSSNPVDMIASARRRAVRAHDRGRRRRSRRRRAWSRSTCRPWSRDPTRSPRAIARGAGARAGREAGARRCSCRRAGAPALLGSGPRGPLPSYSFPENAAMALAAAERYGRWRSAPARHGARRSDASRETRDPRRRRPRARGDASGPVWLDARGPRRSSCAPPASTFAEIVRTTPRGATRPPPPSGSAIRWSPRRSRPGVLHKSDVGGVELGLDGPGRARMPPCDRSASACRRSASPLDGVLLQREVRGGIEALVGVTTDPTFGPLVACGSGRALVELLRDVALCLPPVTDLDAAEMLVAPPAPAPPRRLSAARRRRHGRADRRHPARLGAGRDRAGAARARSHPVKVLAPGAAPSSSTAACGSDRRRDHSHRANWPPEPAPVD